MSKDSWLLDAHKRRNANLEIVNILHTLAESLPDLRFSQILTNIGLNNISSIEESTVTLEKVQKRLQELS